MLYHFHVIIHILSHYDPCSSSWCHVGLWANIKRVFCGQVFTFTILKKDRWWWSKNARLDVRRSSPLDSKLNGMVICCGRVRLLLRFAATGRAGFVKGRPRHRGSRNEFKAPGGAEQDALKTFIAEAASLRTLSNSFVELCPTRIELCWLWVEQV